MYVSLFTVNCSNISLAKLISDISKLFVSRFF
nr:MAG TPA: ATP-utilizing chromatin assembly and remodelling protein [Crassvirales sp.]